MLLARNEYRYAFVKENGTKAMRRCVAICIKENFAVADNEACM